MSKFVKNLITRELTERFKGVEGVAVINPRGIDGHKTHALRRKLHATGLRMTVVKNNLARRAIDGSESKLKGFDKLLDGPSAVVYGQASIANIARLLLDAKKDNDALELRGVFFDGELYTGDKGVEQVSKLPTREEAIGRVVGALLGPGNTLVGALKGPGGTLGALLKTVEEKGKDAGGAEGAAPASA
jgi:large subunit ribosomal protein L10